MAHAETSFQRPQTRDGQERRETAGMSDADIQLYKRVVDDLVNSCRKGQGTVGPERARRGLWNANATPDFLPDQHRFNRFLERLGPDDREVVAVMLEEQFVAGVHEALVVLHKAEVELFVDGLEGTPFQDFVGRLGGWDRPTQESDA